jgi:hypothetical protein
VVSSPGLAGEVIPAERTAAAVFLLIETMTICPQEHFTLWPA